MNGYIDVSAWSGNLYVVVGIVVVGALLAKCFLDWIFD